MSAKVCPGIGHGGWLHRSASPKEWFDKAAKGIELEEELHRAREAWEREREMMMMMMCWTMNVFPERVCQVLEEMGVWKGVQGPNYNRVLYLTKGLDFPGIEEEYQDASEKG
jgi:hypothetical protein